MVDTICTLIFSTKSCQFGGDPIYMTTMSGKTVSGRSTNWDLTGTGSYYGSIGPSKKWFRVWLGGQRQLYYYATNANARVYDWNVNWCGFGTVFPTGDMQLANKQITNEEYPCERARVIQGDKVESNKAEICCGIEDDEWKSAGMNQLHKKISTRHCCFKKDSPVTYLTSMKGDSSHWTMGGITAPIDPSSTEFSIHLTAVSGSLTISSAQMYNYRLQWCGIGERDVNACEPSPPPAPPAAPKTLGSAPKTAGLNLLPPDSAKLMKKRQIAAQPVLCEMEGRQGT